MFPPSCMYWAIRDKTTGWWLPYYQGKQKKGFTYTEPSKEARPRLFTREQDAKLALKWWLMGKYSVTYSYGGGFDDFGEQYPVENVTPQPHRKAENMEIVCVVLLEYVEE